MPDRRTHTMVAVPVGALVALASAPEQQGMAAFATLLGGGLGGYLGGAMPDLLEPATSGHHRDFAHSVTGGALLCASPIYALSVRWREQARALEASADLLLVESADRAKLAAQAFWLNLAAGILVGFLAGYLSHLALDASTPRSLPLLGR